MREDAAIVHPVSGGRLPQGRLGIGWKILSRPVEPASEPSLTVRDVDARLTEIGTVTGTGSQAQRQHLVGELMAAATADEQRFLFGLLSGEVGRARWTRSRSRGSPRRPARPERTYDGR